MISTETTHVYNDMGDGHDEYCLMYSEGEKKYSLIHIGKFYGDMPSSVNTTGMDDQGYRR